jgi:hypothetical protein
MKDMEDTQPAAVVAVLSVAPVLDAQQAQGPHPKASIERLRRERAA